MSLYKMFCADPLHQIKHGVWGKHIWLWYKAHYLSKSELDTLDKRFRVVHLISMSISPIVGHQFHGYPTDIEVTSLLERGL